MHFLYNISIYLYSALMQMASLFHPKAKQWISGRKKWHKILTQWKDKNKESVFWFHCASVGEFEQGRPLIEALREKNQKRKIVITFFSPSGYEMRKNYTGADLVMYLPSDSPSNARAFLDTLKPEKAFFVKYEYWANYFFGCKQRNIPLYLVSAILRPEQRFFGYFKSFWRKVLACVHTFFVQNEETAALLQSIGMRNFVLSGDTRYDRVKAIAETGKSFQQLESFTEGIVTIVGGSTWPADEEVLKMVHEKVSGKIKLIVVPHELTEGHISHILQKWPKAQRWTKLRENEIPSSDILILDTMGMLSSVYRYAGIAMIGGGFGAGIHNTLEAAVWGIPVAFGPKYEKFNEARELIRCEAAVSGESATEMAEKIIELAQNKALREKMGRAAGELTAKNTGATALILKHL